MIHQKANTIVIKIGSNVLTQANGSPDNLRMKALVRQMVYLREQGQEIVLITSGAVAFGRKSTIFEKKTDAVVQKQILAAVGQIELIKNYKQLFLEHNTPIAQIMVTKSDFRDRKHYLNMKNCLEGLLKNNIIPVINENDTVSVTELMFTDNDELAGLVAAMLDANNLILLSNVDGIYKGHPNDPEAELIEKVGSKTPSMANFISSSKSSFGRGGMLTKMNMAKKSADLGIGVTIANGKREDVLIDYYHNRLRCTYFEPAKAKQSPKKWIAHSEHYSKGEVIISAGAENALRSDTITSLLPIGILEIRGNFTKGEIIRIQSEDGRKIGLGKAAYGAKVAAEKQGISNQKPIVHYDYLYLYQDR
ncbi:glutamate 5-kinase [Echinicola strongylocentroti]|uniref:Glutamate 5-kinase n=1 Tax=Echinicola strongylocentroti TaxID=1795355 RepID=A0A2Z4IF80_9BACT|nr:glutamate 5-kinase [Echinicola strongylocentroti]AWW29337.1 glutamate 5-kinase [Echinicola strongylocentroti]